MSAIFGEATITASGTPIQVAKVMLPALPSIVINGVSSGAGSATQQLAQIVIGNPAGATGDLYVGGPAMVKATLVGVGAVLIPGASLTLGQYGGGITLDDIWIDSDTSGNKATLCLVG